MPAAGAVQAARVAAADARGGLWTLPQIWQYLGQPQVSMCTLYRRVQLVAIRWRPRLSNGQAQGPGIHPGLTETDQGRSIVSGPVITGGAFGSFAAARSRRTWLATWLVMSV